MEDVEQQRELPLLAQLIHGSYQDRKTRETKSLAHDKGLGAGCITCGAECSGFELHFWRKVCKNCGCRPQQHNIKLNDAVHQDIVKELFPAKSRDNSLSSDLEDVVRKDDPERRPSQESKKVDMVVPTIRIQSMTLEPDDTGYSHSDSRTKTTAYERSNRQQPRGSSVSDSVFPAVRTPPSTIKENKKQWDRDIPTSPTSQTPNSRRNVSVSSNENMTFQIPESPVAKSSAPLPPSRKESFAEVERQRKLLSQLPPQDFDPKFCSTLNRKQKVAMNKMSSIKKEAAGKGKLTGNEKQQICKSCNKEISSGEKAVCSTYQKQLIYWHQRCFKCKSCNEAIADYIYFWHEDNIYCGRHFAEKFRPRCAGCDELIYADRYTKAEGESWHMEHFTCFKCDRSLADTNYISHKGQPHCMTCYHYNVASKCSSCGLPIQVGEQRISYNNMHWHAYKECFFCRGCNKDLVDFGFLLFNDKLYCSKKCSNM